MKQFQDISGNLIKRLHEVKCPPSEYVEGLEQIISDLESERDAAKCDVEEEGDGG
jgi:hypothetical protein